VVQRCVRLLRWSCALGVAAVLEVQALVAPLVAELLIIDSS
jgi:hypothetical protein